MTRSDLIFDWLLPALLLALGLSLIASQSWFYALTAALIFVGWLGMYFLLFHFVLNYSGPSSENSHDAPSSDEPPGGSRDP